MITSVLVANRGEIARRVFRTCRELGLATVAVHSDADAEALHVRGADAAVRLPGTAPADTYLRGDRLVKAALDADADAVHPGYGFLSENADFARAVIEAGLVWIGPPPEAIEAMASKTRAKELMRAAGVPLLEPVPASEAAAGSLPLLVKASAGGGGRGMRVVRRLADLPGEIAAAQSEAAGAFGDGEVFVEPYLERARHVEVQVLADGEGTVWVLGTRDCSLQRRHQKVVEEAPAPGLDEERTEALHRAAEEAARAVGYRSAGTVEFLVPTADGGPYFLEMNTRLQVEHPVTECVHRVDLVAEQVRIAEGRSLDAAGPPPAQGHAVEARLYAEDPARGWQPQTGEVLRLDVPDATEGTGGHRHPDASTPVLPWTVGARSGVRLDTGVTAGSEIATAYDPMLAKVVAWAPERGDAVRLLADALARARIHGPATNRDLLVRSLRHPEFTSGAFDTGFYERHLPSLTEESAGVREDRRTAALAAALADAAARTGAPEGPGRPPAVRIGGWRNVPSQPQVKTYRAEPVGEEPEEVEVRYRLTRQGLVADAWPAVRLLSAAPDGVRLELDGVRREFAVARYGDRVHVDSAAGSFAFTALPRLPEPEPERRPGSLVAPMPGTVARVADGLVVGDRVAAGQPLLWLEAMKMEHEVAAPVSGVLTVLDVEPGRQVEVGAVLAVVDE